MTGHFYNAISLSCSKSFWESLSPELQEIFLTAAKEAGAEQRTWLQTAAADMLSKMEEGGCTIIDDVDVAAFQEACAPCTRPIVTRSQRSAGSRGCRRAVKLRRISESYQLTQGAMQRADSSLPAP